LFDAGHENEQRHAVPFPVIVVPEPQYQLMDLFRFPAQDSVHLLWLSSNSQLQMITGLPEDPALGLKHQ
jgi:hypothetical protein